MTQEQKARAYDEAIKRAKTMQEKSNGMILKRWLWGIFPELKESKEERIRNVIRGWIYTQPDSFFDNGISKEEMLAWLEKQDEKPQGKSVLEAVNEEKVDNQNCVKSTDNIEPKFQVGEWITNGNAIYHISNIRDDGFYCFDYGPSSDMIQYIDNTCHLWTIQDAEDGDVLYSLDSKQPFIYKDRLQFSQARGYCCINKFGEFAVWYTSKCVICTDKYIPATKEQRDLLFAKMHEEGYEWDEGKKELRKIVQNSNDRLDPLIDEEIDLWIKENSNIHHNNNDVVGLMRDMAYYVATLTRNLYKQKSKWTKEDSLEAGALIDTIKHGLSISFELKDKFITWLKSLKERLEEQ